MATSITEQQAYVLLGNELDKCVAIHARRAVEALEVQAGSRMHDDDAQLHPFQISHGVKSALGSSLDHVHAVRGLLVADQLNMAAPFTLMRAALENAALALWLLAPDDQLIRFTRKLQLEMDDAYDAGTALALTQEPGRSVAQRQADVLAVGARLGVDESALTSRRPGWASKVREASGPTKVDADDLEFTWRWTSGYSHSRRWAHLAMGVREQVRESEPGVGLYSMTASVPALTLAVVHTSKVVQAAVWAESKARLKFR